MIAWIRNYWLELLTFGGIFAVLLICCAPDMTWINTCSDGVHYTYSAEYLMPSHKSSAPLYLLISHIWLYLPFGTEFWKLAFFNVIVGTIGSIFIYLIIKESLNTKSILYGTLLNKRNKIFTLIGAIIYGSSALAISQNTIVETYPFVTTLCLMSYYFAIKKKWLSSAITIGCAGAVHPIAAMFIIPMLIKYKELRSWKRIGIMALFVLFYLYIPLTNRPPHMWHQPNGNGIFGFLYDTYETAKMLSSGLSIWDLPKRIFDTVLQLLLNWNIGIIGLVLYFVRGEIKWYKDILFWLIILPIGYYVVDLAPQTYVYMQPSIAFGCVAIGIGLNKLQWKKVLSKGVVYATGITSIGLLVFNCNYFDIGRTLDPELSAVKFWKELDKVPNGDTLVAQQGWEWAMVYKYNMDYNRNVKVVCAGTLTSPAYQSNLKEMGVNVLDMPEIELGNRPNAMAKWICLNNNDVWISKVTDARTYGSIIVPANINGIQYWDNINLLDDSYSPESVVDGSRDLKWNWIPDNPYDITTGAIEVEKWRWIIFSNYNCMMFGMLGIIGFVPVWILWQLFVRKKQWKVSNFKKVI